MEPIKLRAWDDNAKRMITTFDDNYKIMQNQEDGNIFCGFCMPNGDWSEPILMLYSGLKDKNGVEIYKGDILNLFDITGSVITTNRIPVSYEVVIEGFEFRLFRHDYKLNWGRISRISELCWNCVVVGNIYENSNLLNRQ